jgi:hypothetical protein
MFQLTSFNSVTIVRPICVLVSFSHGHPLARASNCHKALRLAKVAAPANRDGALICDHRVSTMRNIFHLYGHNLLAIGVAVSNGQAARQEIPLSSDLVIWLGPCLMISATIGT